MKNHSFYLFIVYFNVALYATCYQLQRPLEPFLVSRLTEGDGALDYARLQSFFSILQAVGSFVTGYVLDHYSAKVGFCVSFLGSAACYYILSHATSMKILFLSKVPGVFQAGFLCAQLAAAQIAASETERTRVLGRLTMSYTVGMVLGPALGGYLGASGDYYFGAKLAVAGSLLSFFLTLLLPSITAPVSANDKTPKKSKTVTESVVHIIQAVWLVLATKVLTSVANSMGQSAFPIILLEKFSFNEKMMGLTMSAMSVLNAVINGLLLDQLLRLFQGNTLTAVSYFLGGLTFFSFLQAALPVLAAGDSIVVAIYSFLGTTFALSMIQYAMATLLTGCSTSRVDHSEKGTLLGMEHCLFAAARIFAPMTGVKLYNEGGISGLATVCGLIFGGVTALWSFRRSTLAPADAQLVEESNEERKGK